MYVLAAVGFLGVFGFADLEFVGLTAGLITFGVG